MRELLLDAAEAVWWVVTAPLRKIVADGMRELITAISAVDAQDAAPILKWSDPDLLLGQLGAEWAARATTELPREPAPGHRR